MVTSEITIDTQDTREWELSDEELDRPTRDVRLCPMPACTTCRAQ
jgi:hypothetical protein